LTPTAGHSPGAPRREVSMVIRQDEGLTGVPAPSVAGAGHVAASGWHRRWHQPRLGYASQGLIGKVSDLH